MQDYKKYIEFIRYSIGERMSVPSNVDGIDWKDFYVFCLRQNVVGVVFDGLECSEIVIPEDDFYLWYITSEKIKNVNKIVDSRCYQVSSFWEKHGYKCCILKGQANAMMYPSPELRTPGDIDIWVDGDAKQIIKIAQDKAPKGHYSLHHVTMPIYNDVSIEVHYRPVFLDNWWLDKRLKKYTEKEKERQFEHKIILSNEKLEVNSLTDDFNAIYQMLHMWHHLLSTRNSLKQLIDYYYLLKRGFNETQRNVIVDKFKAFGVMKYARGIMWIEKYALGLDEKYLLVEPDEIIGRLLLNETLHYREKRGEKRNKRKKWRSIVYRITNNIHIFRHFPSPVLIAPIYLIWHQWWKWNMKRKLKP